MEEMINYSIIIPHKNCPDLLWRCVESIPQCDDIQIIVVDDNSDDGKKPNLSRKDVDIILLNADNTKGAGKARNVGLEKAKGKWVLFADADDYYVSNFYEIISKYKDSSADLIIFKADSVNSDTLEKSNRHERMNKIIDSSILGKMSPRQIALEIEVPWCKMVRTEFVRTNGIYFDEVLASNDTMFSTKIACIANSIYIANDMLYVVTFREGSLWNSRKKPANYLARMGVYINRSKFLKQQGYKPTPLLISYFALGYINFKTNMHSLWMILKSGELLTGMGTYIKKQIAKRIDANNWL